MLHESRDQAGLFRPLAKAVFTPRSAAEVAATLDAAVAAAMRHPRGPVYMDVPADVLGHARPLAHRDAAPWFEPLPTDVDLDAAAAVLADARVVVWAGGGAVDAEPSLLGAGRAPRRAGGGDLRRPRRAAHRASRARSGCRRTSPRWRS